MGKSREIWYRENLLRERKSTKRESRGESLERENL
jgi:hypothetical protein